MQRSDAKLMQQILQGQHQAFAQLVNRHHKKCFQTAWRELLSKADAQDATQIVFMKIWQRPDTYKENLGATFSTWLYRVTINTCRDIRRKQKNLTSLDAKRLELISTSPIDKIDNRRDIKCAIQKLPDIQRQVINLFYFEELSTKETAEALKLTAKAVESHLMRARKSLKPFLQSTLKEAS